MTTAEMAQALVEVAERRVREAETVALTAMRNMADFDVLSKLADRLLDADLALRRARREARRAGRRP